MVWYAEKEFNLGECIDDTFPVLKLFNLYDDSNIKHYNKINKSNTSGSKPKTVK